MLSISASIATESRVPPRPADDAPCCCMVVDDLRRVSMAPDNAAALQAATVSVNSQVARTEKFSYLAELVKTKADWG
ncbi:unnamed protein product [Gongylonema pulchrum]|uniref:Uncharacterized protein n=1 Tax=Gongylonema pulchrum TaxID=637853 RepID=A0A183DJH1_9BILA|nr:unnamed protein product [Gongylonema pulchrum]